MTPIKLLIFTCIIISSCKKSIPPVNAEVMILIDNTDTLFSSQIDISKDLEKILSWNCINPRGNSYDNLRNGIEIQIASLSDVSDVKPMRLLLAPDDKNAITGNTEARRRIVNQYIYSLHNMVKTLSRNGSNNLKSSKLMVNVCQKAKNLSLKKADKKLMIIYSDFLENSEYYTFYKKSEAQITKDIENMNPVINRLKQDCEFPDLGTITIHAIPIRNPKSDREVTLAVRYWRKLFQSFNGEFNAGAQLELEACLSKIN